MPPPCLTEDAAALAQEPFFHFTLSMNDALRTTSRPFVCSICLWSCGTSGHTRPCNCFYFIHLLSVFLFKFKVKFVHIKDLCSITVIV